METAISQAIIMRNKKSGESNPPAAFFAPDMGPRKGVAEGAIEGRNRLTWMKEMMATG
jgi:hypothetical protein